MIYLWESAESYPESLVGVYQRDSSPDRFELRKGQELPSDFGPMFFGFDVSTEKISRWNVLGNDKNILLVDADVVALLEQLAEGDVQFLDAIVQTSNGELDTYKVVNITHTVFGIDHVKSKYSLIKGTSKIVGFSELHYKEGCLGMHQLARDAEYRSNILVSQELREAFVTSKISGVDFLTPEEIPW